MLNVAVSTFSYALKSFTEVTADTFVTTVSNSCPLYDIICYNILPRQYLSTFACDCKNTARRGMHSYRQPQQAWRTGTIFQQGG